MDAFPSEIGAPKPESRQHRALVAALKALQNKGLALYLREGRPLFVKNHGEVSLLEVHRFGGYKLDEEDLSTAISHSKAFDALSRDDDTVGFENLCSFMGFDMLINLNEEDNVFMIGIDRRLAVPMDSLIGAGGPTRLVKL